MSLFTYAKNLIPRRHLEKMTKYWRKTHANIFKANNIRMQFAEQLLKINLNYLARAQRSQNGGFLATLNQ